MKETIEGIIRSAVIAQCHEDVPDIDRLDIAAEQAAAEIVEMVDTDKWDALQSQDAAWHSIQDEWVAKLAAMKEALEQIVLHVDAVDDGGYVGDMVDIKEIAQKALSATPKEE